MPEKLRERLTPEQRLEGLTPEQQFRGLAPEQLREGLTPEQLAATIDALPAEVRNSSSGACTDPAPAPSAAEPAVAAGDAQYRAAPGTAPRG